MKALVFILVAGMIGACGGGAATPVSIDVRGDACDYCRMIASDPRVAAEIVASGENPKIFDDIGCLRDYLAKNGMPRGAVAFVADHATGEWVRATDATYTRSRARTTPMASGIIAHRNQATRDRDPVAAGGVDVGVASILGNRGSR